MKKNSILILLIIITATGIAAQNQITLYQMNSSVPQSNLINPAFTPDSTKITIGLPVLSSAYIALASPVSYNDVFTRMADDSLHFNSNSILNSLLIINSENTPL